MDKKIAAVWARVSTEDKQEPSLTSQVAEVRQWLESQGWTVPEERIITVHWTSKNILACPSMQKLLGWVRRHEVGAVGTLHLDRFACRMGQMAQILDVFKDGSAEILAKKTPVQTGLLGEAMAMVMTLVKAFQVERADEGSKQGLRDRAVLRGLPTTCQAPYGYRWDEMRTKLLATSDWETRALIVKRFLKGASIDGIRRELHERAIPSPRGREWWPDPTVWGILVDTVNCGEYRALRRESVEPKVRRGKGNGEPTYGRTSSRRLPGIPLTNIVVESPIITKEEHGWMLKRLEQNRLNSKRNGRHDFLLKGMVYYELDNRRYHGRYIRDSIWAYEYPENGEHTHRHPRPYINGPRLEASVESMARKLLTSETVLSNELGRQEKVITQSVTNLENELRGLDRQQNANTNTEAQLLLDKERYKGDISEEAFKRALARLQAERAYITNRQAEITTQLEGLHSKASSVIGLKHLQAQLEERLASREFADRRFVLEALGTRIKVTVDGRVDVEFTIPEGVPKEAIALSSPQNACPLYSLAPIYHPLF